MNILESMWVKILYEPHAHFLLSCFQFEIVRTHDSERFEDLFCKKASLQKFLKIMK